MSGKGRDAERQRQPATEHRPKKYHFVPRIQFVRAYIRVCPLGSLGVSAENAGQQLLVKIDPECG